jgi:dihydroorotate dehydrogenase
MQTDLIACGGVYKPEDVDVLLDAGAKAVQVDSALWRGQWLQNNQTLS